MKITIMTKRKKRKLISERVARMISIGDGENDAPIKAPSDLILLIRNISAVRLHAAAIRSIHAAPFIKICAFGHIIEVRSYKRVSIIKAPVIKVIGTCGRAIRQPSGDFKINLDWRNP